MRTKFCQVLGLLFLSALPAVAQWQMPARQVATTVFTNGPVLAPASTNVQSALQWVNDNWHTNIVRTARYVTNSELISATNALWSDYVARDGVLSNALVARIDTTSNSILTQSWNYASNATVAAMAGVTNTYSPFPTLMLRGFRPAGEVQAIVGGAGWYGITGLAWTGSANAALAFGAAVDSWVVTIPLSGYYSFSGYAQVNGTNVWRMYASRDVVPYAVSGALVGNDQWLDGLPVRQVSGSTVFYADAADVISFVLQADLPATTNLVSSVGITVSYLGR